MPAQLIALTDGPNILLDKPILLLGRHPECDIQLNSRKVSRRHCCIAQVRDYLVVRDLGSTNGIRINGEKVDEGKLHAGDELTIGNFRYQICLDAPLSPPVPSVPMPIDAPQVAPVPVLALARKTSGKLSAKGTREYDPLEDADEPVALEEKSGLGPVLAAKPANPKNAKTERDRTESPESLLPEHLTIVPNPMSSPPAPQLPPTEHPRDDED
jgi:predicted component of type VI protein secretion system